MRATRLVCSALTICASIFALTAQPANAQDDIADAISSQRFIVVDAETGEVFAEKDAHDQVAIASLTKIFTTIEAIERAPLTMEITTDESDLFDSSSTVMGFGPGETFTLEDLLYGMMLPSGNDAAHAIARSIGAQPGDTPEESVDRFVGYMNERVRNMGLTETTLKNPHGLGVPGHVSSAHDLAAFTMYALKYPIFTEIISTAEYDANGYIVTNTNRLLNGYTGLIGGKTGYDEDSGYCLVEAAQRSGNTMISVTLDGVAPTVWYEDNEILLDYGFERKGGPSASSAEINGETVSYRDPDVGLIAGMVTPGASIGTSSHSASVVPTVSQLQSQPTNVAAVESSNNDSAWRTVIPWIVAALVVLAGIAVPSFKLAAPNRRSSRPDRTAGGTPKSRRTRELVDQNKS
jgi:D-alanyl-D-alanine carboxypeptidase (penicillin-binding protein 5/6)